MKSLQQAGSRPNSNSALRAKVPVSTGTSSTFEIDSKRFDAGCIAALVGLVVAVFWKTVFFAQPVSRLGLLAEWDSLFSAFRQGLNTHLDPSAVLLAVPTYTHIAALYQSGQLPLWNALNAFGAPLVGDVQATVFSPLRLLFNCFPSSYTYNLELVGQVAIAAVCTFLLTRNLGASRIGALLAAVAYAFSPFVLWYLELQSGVGFSFNPLVLWLFARAARTKTVAAAVVAGIGCGATILMGHPETSFFAIIAGCMLFAGLTAGKVHPIEVLRNIAIAGASAFCICAPTFIPFIEFAKNSDCYKYAVGESAFVPWQAILLSVANPASGGASPFLGILTVALIPLAFLRQSRSAALSVGFVTVVSLILSAKLWPFSVVSQQPPFNYLITVYALPLYLLCVACLASLGLTNLERRSAGAKSLTLAFVLAGLCVGLPVLVHVLHLNVAVANFDLTLPDVAVSWSSWRRDLVLIVIGIVTVAVSVWRGGARTPRVLGADLQGSMPVGTSGTSLPAVPEAVGATTLRVACVALLILNSISVVASAKPSLPVYPKFETPPIALLQDLAQSKERSLGVGTHLAKPDVNLLYGVDDVRSINAMLPQRYVSFVTACGGSADQFTQVFGEKLSATLDLGSVRYVYSLTPVINRNDDTHSLRAVLGLPLELCDGVTVLRASYWADWRNAQAWVSVWLKCEPGTSRQITLVLKDSSGEVIWFSDRLPAKDNVEFSVPLPINGNDAYSVELAAFDPGSGTAVGQQPLTDITATTEGADPHFKLVSQYDNNVRLYENTGALPRAYFVGTATLAPSRQDALNSISLMNFDPRETVVIESDTKVASGAGGAFAPANITKREAAKVELSYSSKTAGFVVLTDTYFSGWKAYVDGQPTPVLRANYLFRAVAVPAGGHTVTFKYEPLSFLVGSWLFAGFWLFVGAILIGLRILKAPPAVVDRFSNVDVP